MRYYGATDIGLCRKQNQDCFLIVENEGNDCISVVCDGIGGGLAGDVASKMVVSYLHQEFLKKKKFYDDLDVKHWLEETIQGANDHIFMESCNVEAYKGMGTTCVGVLNTANGSYIFNVGDSRIYAIYENEFICLTEDHSFAHDLLKAGEITEEQAKFHPNRNMLTNAVGIWNQIKIDINKIREGYEILLICSDGLHGYVSEEEIYIILKSKCKLDEKVKRLIEISKNKGGYDNVSVILLAKEENQSYE